VKVPRYTNVQIRKLAALEQAKAAIGFVYSPAPAMSRTSKGFFPGETWGAYRIHLFSQKPEEPCVLHMQHFLWAPRANAGGAARRPPAKWYTTSFEAFERAIRGPSGPGTGEGGFDPAQTFEGHHGQRWPQRLSYELCRCSSGMPTGTKRRKTGSDPPVVRAIVRWPTRMPARSRTRNDAIDQAAGGERVVAKEH